MEFTSRHPYDPFVPDDAEILIIGSMMPSRFCRRDQDALFGDDVDFYLGARDNDFWRMVSETAGAELRYENTEEAVSERKALLTRIHAGITDLVEECTFSNRNPDDDSYEVIRYSDISALLYKYPKIDTLIYADSKVPEMMFNALNGKYREQWGKFNKNGNITANHRVYSVCTLYSKMLDPAFGATKKIQIMFYKQFFKLD